MPPARSAAQRFEAFVAQVGRRLGSRSPPRHGSAGEYRRRTIPTLFATATDDAPLKPAANRRNASGPVIEPRRESAMTDLFSFAAQQAQGRRRQMLRTAWARPSPRRSPIHCGRGHAQSRWPAVARPARRRARRYRRAPRAPPRPSASSAWWQHTCGARCTTGADRRRPSCPRRGERFEGVLPPVVRGALLRDPQAGRRALSPRRLCHRRHPDAAASRRCWRSPSSSARNPGRRRHLVRQDHAGQCATGRDRGARRARRHPVEDTRELQCAAADCVALRTKPGVASMADLVRSTLRLRPDRIIVGEVRGPEALDMLKAWNTGHPGGIATVHANSAARRSTRLEQLIQEAVVTVPRELIARGDRHHRLLAGRGTERRVETVAERRRARSRRRLRPEAPRPPVLHAFPATETDSCAVITAARVRIVVAYHRRCVRRAVGCRRGSGGRLRHAVGGAAPAMLESVQGPVAKIVAVIIIIVTGLTLAFGDIGGRLSAADPDRVRPLDRLRRFLFLPVVLFLRRRGADR